MPRGNDFSSILARRLTQYTGHNFDIGAIIAIWTPLSQHGKWCMLKTWLRAWTTSRRMNSTDIAPCTFGCAHGEDSWNHYIQCVPLWTLACLSHSFRAPSSPQERLGVLLYTTLGANASTTAYRLYHKVHGLRPEERFTMDLLQLAHDINLADETTAGNVAGNPTAALMRP